MIIRLHRWQPRSQRYRTQNFNMGESKPFMDLLLNRAMFQADDKTTSDQIVARTQRVDRILFNDLDGCVDVWLSPIVDRKYEQKKHPGGESSVSKAKPSDLICHCHHSKDNHATSKRCIKHGSYLINNACVVVGCNGEYDQVCLIPGCKCTRYDEWGLRNDILNITASDTVDTRKIATRSGAITPDDPITDDDVPL